jgi:plastocyanin
MDVFDSRRLTNQDSFGQLFPQPGTYEYFVTAAPGTMRPSHERGFRLSVQGAGVRKGEGSQHLVLVYWDEQARQYTVDQPELEITPNDHVTWHCERMTGSPPFAVRGEGDKSSFNSASLGPHAAFMHFFLTAGTYAYAVNGSGEYFVEVIDHRKLDGEVYSKRAADAPLVMISQGRPDKAHIEIVTGQTVIWMVEEERDVFISSLPRGARSA